MKNSLRTLLYVLLVAFMLLSFYAIFNAGNPRSLFRLLVRDTSYDVLIALGCSMVVVVLVIAMGAGEENAIRHMLEINREYIRELRRKGRSEEAIAQSFLQELGSRKGLLDLLAKRRVLRYLSRIQ
jgi:hypothetical protein